MNNAGSANNDLGRLYRRFTRTGALQALPEADALQALAEGEHSAETERALGDVARSGLHADLLRFARALAPESARLGHQLEEAYEVTMPAHRAHRGVSRHATARRGWLRVAASLAACLVVALTLWTAQQRHQAPSAVATTAPATALPDRIFASAEAPAKPDEIFNGSFKGDEIFRGAFNDS